MAEIGQFLDKAWEGKAFIDLAEAPIDAMQGLSKEDAVALQQAFNIKTIRDLATHQYVLVAQAIVALSGAQQAAPRVARAAEADPVLTNRQQTKAGQAEAASEAFAG